MIEAIRGRFELNSTDGFIQLFDGDFGGCKGNPKNGWKERRWTSWSCKEMAAMLTEAGLQYREGKTVRLTSFL